MLRRSPWRFLALAAALIAIASTATTFRRHALAHATTISPPFLPASTDPHAILAEADRLAWVFNSTKSAPLYARSEKMFAAEDDAAAAVHTKVGLIRATA